MISDVIEPCAACSRRPSRLAVVGDGNWRVRCGCGTRVERIFADSSSIGEPPVRPSAEELRTLEFIHRLLADSEPAGGTLVERYLRSRGIRIGLPAALRYVERLEHRPSGKMFPAMVAAIVDVDGRVIGLHRTYLDPTGERKADVRPQRMQLGRCKGGAVRLGEAGSELGVAEGIETALSVMQATGLPTWCALSASGLATLELPPTVRSVVIVADGDKVGPKPRRGPAIAGAERGGACGSRVRRPVATRTICCRRKGLEHEQRGSREAG